MLSSYRILVNIYHISYSSVKCCRKCGWEWMNTLWTFTSFSNKYLPFCHYMPLWGHLFWCQRSKRWPYACTRVACPQPAHQKIQKEKLHYKIIIDLSKLYTHTNWAIIKSQILVWNSKCLIWLCYQLCVYSCVLHPLDVGLYQMVYIFVAFLSCNLIYNYIIIKYHIIVIFESKYWVKDERTIESFQSK